MAFIKASTWCYSLNVQLQLIKAYLGCTGCSLQCLFLPLAPWQSILMITIVVTAANIYWVKYLLGQCLHWKYLPTRSIAGAGELSQSLRTQLPRVVIVLTEVPSSIHSIHVQQFLTIYTSALRIPRPYSVFHWCLHIHGTHTMPEMAKHSPPPHAVPEMQEAISSRQPNGN